jgi:hypothetical protein
MNYFFLFVLQQWPSYISKGHKQNFLRGSNNDIFLQNNMFIPRVVSDKILKLQHQKELVVEAMLNF